MSTRKLAIDNYPQIDFTNRPTYLPNNVLALTFDDGPDSVDDMNPTTSDNTRKVLDVLQQKGVHATFFINTNNYTDVTMDDQAKSYIQRMWREGHEIGNHTVHHAHLGIASQPMDPGAPTEADIEAEITGVPEVLRRPDVLGSCAPHLTLFRAPYGEPYQPPNDTTPRYTLVAPIVARHAVEIGWAIDTFDYNCLTPSGAGDPDCVYNNFVAAVATPGSGNYGIVLMHAVQPQTATALPRILDYIQQHGFILKSVEDVVRARYGMSSAELVPDDGTGGSSDGNCNATSPDGGSGGSGGSGGTGGHAGGTAGSGGGSGGAGGSSGTSGANSPAGGCGCEVGGRGDAPLPMFLILLFMLRRRRLR